MDFTTITFLFCLLPLTLVLYLLVPERFKNVALLLVSLLFFSWGTPEYLLLILCSIVFNYFTALEIDAYRQNDRMDKAKVVLIASVIVNVLLLGFFKYYGFLVSNINALLGTSLEARTLPAPIGLSFYTFTLLSYLFDVYRDKAPATKNILNFSLYVTFFPKLVSGPIVQYADFAEHPKSFSWERFGDGTRLFLIGMGKKVLIANLLGTTFYAVKALNDLTFLSAWVGALSYTLMLYMDFGGYSDMAVGLSRMLGFECKHNFNYPYLADSITDFWRRWHISLGAWFREYVYFPLGGSRVGKAKTIRNLFVVWALTGIWHGASWTFIFWGLYYGVLQVLEKFVLKRFVDSLHKPLKHIFTMLLVIVGWVFFFSDSLGMAFSFLGSMLCFNGFCDASALYYLGGSWLLLIIAIVASYPIGATVGKNLLRRNKIWKPLSVIFFAAILFLSLACMMNDTYSTFLYAQF